jgi:uncharacterized membrane protein
MHTSALISTWWLLLLFNAVFQGGGSCFVTSSHLNQHSRRIWGIGQLSTGSNHNSYNKKTSTTTTSFQTTRSSSPSQQQHVPSVEQAHETIESTITITTPDSSDDTTETTSTDHELPVHTSHNVLHSTGGGAIEVSAAIELPFPKCVAFDAFSDLSRQSTFSPWLKSVEYIEGERNSVGSKTKWKLSYLGLRFTWHSISTLQDRTNGVIEWESITGLQNNGRVTFEELHNNRTYMNMTMSFVVPKFAARLIGPHKLGSIVEKRILENTVRNFRQIVIDNDWKMMQRQQQQQILNSAESPSSSSRR